MGDPWNHQASRRPAFPLLKDASPADIAAAAKAVAEDEELQAEIRNRVEPYERGAQQHRRMRKDLGLP